MSNLPITEEQKQELLSIMDEIVKQDDYFFPLNDASGMGSTLEDSLIERMRKLDPDISQFIEESNTTHGMADGVLSLFARLCGVPELVDKWVEVNKYYM